MLSFGPNLDSIVYDLPDISGQLIKPLITLHCVCVISLPYKLSRNLGAYPTSLSEELYTQLDKPAHCKPKGGGDCRHYDFLGDRAPQFEDIQVKADGKVSFTVQSKAFKKESGLHVESTDFGKTWMVKSSN